jgi:hypothetical protein
LAPERAEIRRATQRRGGAGEDDRAALRAFGHIARDHLLGDFPAIEEAGEAGHLPHLEVLARRLAEDALRHVGADVEHHDLDRPDGRFDLLDQRDHFLFLARIAGKGTRGAAVGLDLRDQGLQLVEAAARDAGHVALARETARDGAAGGVTGADDQCGLWHRFIP